MTGWESTSAPRERLPGQTPSADAAANFAWQFGGGLLWEIFNRLTFDVGDRYFQIDTITQPGAEPNQFSASELMFTRRLYEPFRSWRR
jgi:opacity protein-like surface antigen